MVCDTYHFMRGEPSKMINISSDKVGKSSQK